MPLLYRYMKNLFSMLFYCKEQPPTFPELCDSMMFKELGRMI